MIVRMSSMPNGRETIDVILEGAMRALARQGPNRLSMTDICREARVSRGTLYRYFSNRDEVLEAINQQIASANREVLDAVVAAEPALDKRVRVVLHSMITFPDLFPHMSSIFEHEPRTALDFLTREMPRVLETLTEYLRPALETSAPVVSGAVTVEDVVEMFYRLVTSSFLLPTPGVESLDVRIADLWDVMATAGRKPLRVAAAPSSNKRRARAKA